jgi:hypothetical protein
VLVEENAKSMEYRRDLANNYLNRGLARRDPGDPAGAAADARRALGLFDGLPSRGGYGWLETACAHAALAGLAGSARACRPPRR